MSVHPKTIKYNVGGKLYEVSADIINKHPNSMLARIASEEWSSLPGDSSQSGASTDSDESKPIFINGDSDRFRYVLDYLVRGRVNLPLTTSRDAVLADLEYYGIEMVDDNSVMEYAANAIVIKNRQSEQAKAMMKLFDEEAELAAAKRYFKLLAHRCYINILSKDRFGVKFLVALFGNHPSGPYQELYSAEAHHAACDKLIAKYKELFQEFMAEYGLRCTNLETVSLKSIKFELIEASDQTNDAE